MPALFVFLLKVNVALLLFCAGYYLVLRHLTFYTLNRIYLVTAIVFASVYPEINLSGFAERHQQIAKPVQAVIYRWQAPAEKLIQPLAKPDYWQWVEITFWAGAALLAIRLLMQLYSLSKLYRSSMATQIYDHDVRVIKGDGGPFSFWKSIYVNPDNHAPAELKAILLHEQVHINEWHTLDILLAELSTIFYWFNPGVWLMKRAIRENVEFITDQKILNKGIDSRQYQYSLVSVSFATSPNTIVNHFNISTIKKRIIMMNAKRSSGIKLTRYAFLIPAVVSLLLIFSISKAALVTKSHTAIAALKIKATLQNAFINLDNAATKTINGDKKLNTTTAKTNDTVKNGGIFISTPVTDSINFVINGVKANKAAFKTLDPKQVFSIDALSAGEANKVFSQPGNKNTVMFVTTKDSEAGKNFKERLDKLTNRNAAIVSDLATGFSSSSAGGNSFSIVSDDNDDDSSKTTSPNPKVIFVGSKHALTFTKSVNLKLDTIKFKGHYKILTLTKPADPSQIYVNTAPDSAGFSGTAVTVNGYSSNGLTYTTNSSNSRLNISASKAATINSHFSDHETDINNVQSRIIVIDGKQATENDLKKLPASDIQGISVKSGTEVTKKYGDKAKNGVLFITTKKG